LTGTVVILGAGAPDGLGGLLAQKFADDGQHVIVSGRTMEKVEAVATQVSASGGSIEACQIDVTVANDQDKLFETAAAHGDLTAVIYNAGGNAIIPFEEQVAEDFEQFWRVGCFGAFLNSGALAASGHF